jgi:pseudouridine kinase
MKKVVCVGASLVDLTFRCENAPMTDTSNPARLHKSAGGVVRNIAHHLALLGIPVQLLTVLGKDSDGQWLSDQCSAAGIDMSRISFSEKPTGTFASIATPDGDLFIGAVSSETDDLLTTEFLIERESELASASIVVADCNLSVESLRWLISFCNRKDIPLIIETVSVPKSVRLKSALPGKLLLVKPNREELAVFEHDTHVTPEEKIAHLHTLGFENVWLSRGIDGSLYSDGSEIASVPAPRVNVIDVNGAGDAMLAAWIWARLNDKPSRDCVRYGHAAAACLLEVFGAIRNDFSADLLESRFKLIR